MSTLIWILRLAAAAICVYVVIVLRDDVGWTSVGVMLLALLGLLAVLASYNRRFR